MFLRRALQMCELKLGEGNTSQIWIAAETLSNPSLLEALSLASAVELCSVMGSGQFFCVSSSYRRRSDIRSRDKFDVSGT